jgi:hypothetical protein
MKHLIYVSIIAALASTSFAELPATQPASHPASQPSTAAVSEKAQAWFKAIEKDVSSFTLDLHYYGDSDKPFYNLLLSVPEYKRARADAFSPACVISTEQAMKIAAYFRDSGLLDTANDVAGKNIIRAAGPCYVATLRCGKLVLSMDLGWSADMLKQLDGLRTVLDDANAGKPMDTLIGRLSGLRKQWQADVAPK